MLSANVTKNNTNSALFLYWHVLACLQSEMAETIEV